MAHLTDRQLVRRVLRKDPRAFEAFFNANFDRLYRFCAARVDNTADCDDIVQETIVKAIRNLEGYRGEAALFTWLCQICRNEIASWYRSPHARGTAFVSVDEPANACDPEDADCARATEEMVHVALGRLPCKYAAALEWKYVGGHTVEEIAARLGLGTTAAQSLLARARRRFRRLYATLENGTDPAGKGRRSISG